MHMPCPASDLSGLVRALRLPTRRINVKKENEKEQPGDILGISNPGGPKLPHPPSDGSTPEGIDVRPERGRHWGTEDIPQSDGAAGMDMGAGGSGPQIASEDPRRDSTEET